MDVSQFTQVSYKTTISKMKVESSCFPYGRSIQGSTSKGWEVFNSYHDFSRWYCKPLDVGSVQPSLTWQCNETQIARAAAQFRDQITKNGWKPLSQKWECCTQQVRDWMNWMRTIIEHHLPSPSCLTCARPQAEKWRYESLGSWAHRNLLSK